MKVRNKNPVLKDLVEGLSRKEQPIWKAVAKGLNRPRNVEFKVNLYKLEKHGKNKETIVVPGTVLGSGEIKKHLTVAAYRFSGSAKEKIEKAGGKALEIEELVKENPKGSGVRIFG